MGVNFLRGGRQVKRSRLCELLLGLLFALASSGAEAKLAEFPFGISSTTSANKRYTLEASVCQPGYGQCDRKLWLVDHRTNRRRLFLEISRTVRAAWAPHRSVLFVNDDESSSDSFAFLYFPDRKKRVDLGGVIDHVYPADRRYEKDSHHYLNGIRWVKSNSLIVRRFGHFDHPAARGDEFSVCYRVNTSGTVRRLKQSRQEKDVCEDR
jgi:hypothetical protein